MPTLLKVAKFEYLSYNSYLSVSILEMWDDNESDETGKSL